MKRYTIPSPKKLSEVTNLDISLTLPCPPHELP